MLLLWTREGWEPEGDESDLRESPQGSQQNKVGIDMRAGEVRLLHDKVPKTSAKDTKNTRIRPWTDGGCVFRKGERPKISTNEAENRQIQPAVFLNHSKNS